MDYKTMEKLKQRQVKMSKKSLYHKIGLRLASPPPQLELFPLSDFYSFVCMTTKVCYKDNCLGCRYASAMRKDYDYFTHRDDNLI